MHFNTTLVSVRPLSLLADDTNSSYFNTTLVSVRRRFLTSRSLVPTISIQHLFRFDTTNKLSSIVKNTFQYNTCFGST